MSAVFAAMGSVIEIGLVLLAAAAALVSVVGIACSQDAYGRLIYGSIASGGALVALIAAVAVRQGASIVTLQGIVLVVLMVPSSALTAHRIAATVRDRAAASSTPGSGETAP